MLRRTSLCIASLWVIVSLDAHAQAPSAGAPDTAARSYFSRCTGCHTIGKGALTGPDLARALTWQPADLRAAIVRMQDRTGPIAPTDVDALVLFLKDEQRDARVALEEARIAAQFAVELDPPSADLGRELFFGREAFQNGGTACVACHHFADEGGGSLGPDLNGVFARMGRQGLVAATENPAFKVMGPMYRERPVTRQEALHLVRYLEVTDHGAVKRAGIPWLPASGLVVFALGFVLMFTRRLVPRGARSRKEVRS